MNILVVSDNFTSGGLETHIFTLWNKLKENNQLWFCFSNFDNRELIDSSLVYTGFHFAFNETLAELKEDVDRLVDIINKRKIDVIHVHPWYGLYPAYFAASFTGVKLVYTYHGTVSVNYNADIPNELFMQEILTSSVSQVFCVSKGGQEAIQSINCGRTTLLRNPVVTENLPLLSRSGSRKWALVSRLDSDKTPSISKFLMMLPDLNISAVDIYGDGDHADNIRLLAEKTEKEINLLGHCDNVINRIAEGGYDGVIGLGRCAIEGLALGLPVLFIGYGNVIGLIDSEIYDIVSDCNFVPIGIKEKSIHEINKQIEESYHDLKNYNHRERIKADFGVESICNIYINKLNEITPMGSTYVRDLYNDILSIPDPENVLLHASTDVWDRFRQRVAPRTTNIYIKDMILMEQKIDEQQSEIRRLNNEIEKCRQELQSINQKIDSMGFRYFVNQSIEWRKNSLKKK